jgi:hypothetical protein
MMSGIPDGGVTASGVMMRREHAFEKPIFVLLHAVVRQRRE